MMLEGEYGKRCITKKDINFRMWGNFQRWG
jgi:hypothetical protein